MGRFLFGLLLVATLLPIPVSFAVAGATEIRVLDEKSVAVEHAVVSLKPLFETSELMAAPEPQAMQQKDALFSPFVLPVQIGGTVTFPNLDEFRHHVYSFSKAKRFQLRLYGKDETKQIVFENPGVVALGCNIHDNMLAYVYVTDLPIFSQTNTSGTAQFENLAAGSYEIHIWHPDMKRKTKQVFGTLLVEANNEGAMPKIITLQLRKVRKMQQPPAEDDYN